MFCIVGLVAHVGIMTDKYFRFEATTALQLNVPTDVDIPAVSVCYTFADLINVAAVNAARNLTLQPMDWRNTSHIWTYKDDIQSTVTLQDIFKFTPPSDQVFNNKDIAIRYPNGYVLAWYNATSAQSVFDVDKFFVQDFVCYRFQLRTNGSYDYNKVMSSLSFQGMAYQLAFDWNKFNVSQVIVPTIHRSRTIPSDSLHFSPELKRFVNWSDDEPFVNVYSLTYQYIHNWRLPHPYHTKCIDYEQVYHTDFCRNNCTKSQLLMRCKVNQTLRYFNKLPFTDIIGESERINMNYSLLHNRQLSHINISKIYHDIEKYCNDRFNRLACTDRVFMTRKISEEVLYTNESYIRVYVPLNPNIYIQYKPMLDLFEYLTYVMSCLGIWTGMSVYNLNIVNLLIDKFMYKGFRHNRLFISYVIEKQFSYDVRLRNLEKKLRRMVNWH